MQDYYTEYYFFIDFFSKKIKKNSKKMQSGTNRTRRTL